MDKGYKLARIFDGYAQVVVSGENIGYVSRARLGYWYGYTQFGTSIGHPRCGRDECAEALVKFVAIKRGEKVT